MKLELIFQYLQRQLNKNYATKYMLRKIEWVSIYNKLYPYKYLPKETVALENSPFLRKTQQHMSLLNP